jgi:hypothetical protein
MGHFLDICSFFLKYTPFWAVPTIFISLEFAYVYWLKSIRKVAFGFVFIGSFSGISIIYYFWHGGPEGAVHHFLSLFN